MAEPALKVVDEDAETLSTQDWIDAARRMLIREGIGGLKIYRLAKECKVSRGGFYWRFKSREDLHAKLLEEWKRVNTKPLIDALEGPGTPNERLHRLAYIWLEEAEFDPLFDNAVRAWAAGSVKVAKVVKQVDSVRLAAFERIYLDAGHTPEQAMVRARVLYYTQIGYYALGVHETRKRREDLLEIYMDVLGGPRVLQT